MSPLPQVKTGNPEPLYNIGVVSRMTGLSMATLRAWERRYDFPEAERSAGGHRLYSENDIMRLIWVKQRIDEGMQTAQAIMALRHQEKQEKLQPAAVERPAPPRAAPPAPVETYGDKHSYVARLIEALLARNLAQADQLIGEALAVTSPDELILSLISPAMAAVGDAWERGQVSVATEHLATNYLRQRLLIWMLNSPPPRQMPPVILACAPGEWHEGSLLILGALLRRRGYPVAYLGQSVPLEDLAVLVAELQPSLVILVAMLSESADRLLEWPEHMPRIAESGHPLVAYGGLIFTEQPELRSRMRGLFLGDTLKEGLQQIETLLERVER